MPDLEGGNRMYMQERLNGRRAAARGVELDGCPHLAGTAEAHAWRMGWWDHDEFEADRLRGAA